MLLGFVLGLAAGVILMAVVQVQQHNKEFEEELERLEKESVEKNSEIFTYDCLNDPDPIDEEIDKHIPRIN